MSTAVPTEKSDPPPVTWRGVGKNLIVVAIFLVFTLVVGVAFAYYGSTSVPGGNGAAAATTVNQGATPTVVAGDGSVTVSWAATTLASGPAVSGYLVKRYAATTLVLQTTMSACSGTITATTCTESNLPTGQWKYSITPTFATSWVGLESAKSATVATTEKDSTPPVNDLSLSVVTGTALKNANTIYYRGAVAGSVRLSNALTDAASGPASSTTQALSGDTTGWTHSPSTVSTPSGGPYVSNVFNWSAGTSGSPTEAVIGRDVKNNSATTSVTFVNDSTAPAASVTYSDGYQSGRSVEVAFAASDVGSGLAPTRQLQRAYTPLTGTTCGTTYTAFARIGPVNPTSPYVDSQVTNATCYKYRYIVTDLLGNQTIATSANVAKVDYRGAVSETTGLLSQWRLGEKEASRDTFTGTAGVLLSSRSGEVGSTWSKRTSDTATAVLTDANRLRRNAAGGVTYVASAVPTNPDYTVSADVVVKSLVTADFAAVVGRLDPAVVSGQGTRYMARYNRASGAWELIKLVNNVQTSLGTASAQTLTVGQSYRLSLDMRGTTIRLLVDGGQRISVTDSAITATGRGGVRLGDSTSSVIPTNTTGFHLDNFGMAPQAIDGKGSNPGVYVNQPTLGTSGALRGDADTATTFDGVNEYVQMLNTTGLPVGASVRSVEAWFKTTSSAQQVIFGYGSRAPNQEFALWLDAGASTMRAWGHTNDAAFALPAPVNDGAWHQVIKTYDGTSITLFVDGVALPSQAIPRSTVIDAYGFGIGAVIVPGDANSGYSFNGALDEVSFYTTALDQATVTDHYQLGNADAADTAGPTGGSVDVSGLVGTGSRYSTSKTLSLDLAKGSDPSGVAQTGAELQRATATLSSAGGTANGTCGTFDSYAVIGEGSDPDTTASDTVPDEACYSYRYIVSDTLGNTTTYTSPDVKVDTTEPAAPTLVHSAFTNTFWSGAGSTVVYYRSAATSGSFTTTASATDPKSGISGYTFPALGTNWTSTAGASGVNTYSWTGAPAAPGTKSVLATNHASLVSAGAPFTLTADNTAPTTGTISYEAATSTTVNVTFTTGTDTGSGVGDRLVQRSSATLTGSTCGTFSAFSTVTNGTNPSSPLVNTVARGMCYTYRYVVSDNVGNTTTATGTTVLKVSSSYQESVRTTAGLLNYWRLGEDNSGTSDTFTGPTGTVLSAHQANSGASWTRRPNDSITAVLTNQGRLRKSNATGGVAYYTSDTPASADYLVQADLTVKSLVSSAGVLGRLNPAGAGTGTFYFARYDTGASQWQLLKSVNGAAGVLNVSSQTLTVGSTYTVGLDMSGPTIRLLVNGTQRISATDSSITAAGQAAVGFGDPSDSAVVSDTQGLHLDNFTMSGTLLDSYGTNDGNYLNQPGVGVDGAIAGDSDTAAVFDGVSQYGTAARQIADDLSVEFWFKSTQGLGTSNQWRDGAGLVDAGAATATNDFGVSLRSDGKVVAGVGSSVAGQDVSIVSTAGGYNNGSWHHVVFTRTRTSGAIRLYVDGGLVGSGTAGTNALTGQANLSFGRSASGGNFYAGSLDEIAAYNTALSAETVTSHYGSGR